MPNPRFILRILLLLLVGLPAVRAEQIRHISARARDPDRTVSVSSILPFLEKSIGDSYDPQTVNRDIRRLQETGRYSYVGAEVEQDPRGGISLVYIVEERPRLRRLIIEGGEHYSNTRIRNLLELELGERVDEAVIRRHLEPLRERYHNAYFPDVSFDFALSPPDDDNFSVLTLRVDEGERQSVGRITFSANTEYSDTQLRRAMMQKSTNLFSFLTSRGRYDERTLRQDLGTIEELYRRKGYLDARAGPIEIEEGFGRRLIVHIPIQRFDRYRVRSIRIEGNTLYPSSLLGAQAPLQVGGYAETDRIERGRRAIQDYYSNRGYSQTNVREQIRLAQDNQVDVIYTVREGRVATVRNVTVRGNIRTKDHVLRRELLVSPGDTLNEVRVRNSAARLRNLGFFDRVNQAILPTEDPDVFDVEFEVEEGRSGQFMAGAGFSSVENIVGFLELTQGNFDLFDPPRFTGGGEKLQIRLQLGTRRRDATLTYTKPWFLDRRMTLVFSAFQNERRFLSDDYDQRNTGMSLGLRKGLTDFWRGAVTYSLESIDVFNVDEDVSEFIRREEGENVRSGLDFSLTRDTRDHVWNPTRGGRVILNTGFTGGPLGFDTDIYDVGVRSSYYYPIVWDHVLNIHAEAQSVERYGDSDHVPIFDRRFLGGARTIRGFRFREVSPVDDQENPIGGKTSMFASVEYTIPLTEMFRYALFYDWGVVNPDAYDPSVDDVNSSYGMGLRIDMPGFPLRFDYSWQDQSSPHNQRDRGRFSFLIGHSF